MGTITSLSKNPVTLILLKPKMNIENPIADKMIENISNLVSSFSRTFFISMTAKTSATTMKGSMIQ